MATGRKQQTEGFFILAQYGLKSRGVKREGRWYSAFVLHTILLLTESKSNGLQGRLAACSQ